MKAKELISQALQLLSDIYNYSGLQSKLDIR